MPSGFRYRATIKGRRYDISPKQYYALAVPIWLAEATLNNKVELGSQWRRILDGLVAQGLMRRTSKAYKITPAGRLLDNYIQLVYHYQNNCK